MNPRNIGDYIKVDGGDAWNIVAGGTGDATEVNGRTINRDGMLSAVAVVTFSATLAEGKKLAIGAKLQQSDDSGSNWGTATELKPATDVVATGPTGGGTVKGQVELPINLDPCSKTIRVNVTPDLDAANTDVAKIGVAVVLGGATVRPV